MATYGAVVNRIIEELPRSDSSITAIVSQNLLSAIDFYTTDRFWFNEKQTTLTTSSSLAYYAWPTDLLEIDSVVVFDTGGTTYELEPMDFKSMNALDGGTTFGRPIWYSTYNKQFRLYPRPDATYTFVVSHQYAPATLSATTESNVWTTEAESMIRARTKYLLAAGKFKDADSASFYKAIEQEEYNRLKDQTEKLLNVGTLTGSGF